MRPRIIALALCLLIAGVQPALSLPQPAAPPTGKADAALAAALAQGGEVRALLEVAGPAPALAPDLEALGLDVVYAYHLVDVAAVRGPGPALRAALAMPWVVAAHGDATARVQMDDVRADANVPPAHAAGYDGAGATVAVVDTGLRLDHPDFAGRIVGCIQFTAGTRLPGCLDDNGHGTHVASIAAGSGAATGAAYGGVAPGADVVAVKVLGATGVGFVSDIIAGVEWVADQGAASPGPWLAVLSLSVDDAPCGDGSHPLTQAVDAAWNGGVVVVVAAGNVETAAQGPCSVLVPGDARHALTVGAVRIQNASTASDDTVAAFSGRGPTADGRTKPDVAAPGVGVTAASHLYPAIPRDTRSGTSMATPVVAGVAALLLQKDAGLQPAAVRHALTGSAVDVGPGGVDNRTGHGVVDAWAALAAV